LASTRAKSIQQSAVASSAPKPNWSDEEIADRYENAFDVWMRDGVAGVIDEDGRSGPSVRYWTGVRQVTEDLFGGGELRPGRDYALTEVVHCKSRAEAGVGSAVRVCAPLYLPRVVALSPARLIVVLGDYARNAARSVFDYQHPGVLTPPLRLLRRTRRIVFLAHPATRQKTPKYPKRLVGEELTEAQEWLRG
jgi:uracil-DNA glycosylase